MKGIVIKQSLQDPSAVEGLEVIEHVFDREPDWDVYTVEASRDQVEELSRQLLKKWYAHFWEGKKVVVAFRDKIFEFDYDDKASWKPAVSYGLSMGIPLEQLDFPID